MNLKTKQGKNLAKIASKDALSARLVKIMIRMGRAWQSYARVKAPIDTGMLRDSLQFKVIPQGKTLIRLELGSYGVPYAAAQEFGINKIVRVRQHRRVSPLGRSYNVRTHRRRMVRRAANNGHGFMRPAIERIRPTLVRLLQDIAKGN